MVKDFEFSSQYEDQQFKHAISLLAQLVTSIPDKARPQTSVSLSSQYPFGSLLKFSSQTHTYFLLR